MRKVHLPNHFKQPARLRRYQEGQYVDGEWQDEVSVERTILAVIQPASQIDYERLPEGNKEKPAISVWADEPLQFGIDGKIRPDEIMFENRWYKLTGSENWINRGYDKGIFVLK